MNKLFWLNDWQWANMEPLLPENVQGRVDDRRVISGIIHVMRSGCRWSDAPKAYGPSKTLYDNFIHWSLAGMWEEMFAALAATGGPPAEALLDSSHTKVRRFASGA
jgi:transposase